MTSYRMVRQLVARSLGALLPAPLRPWLYGLYAQVDLIEGERDFLKWLTLLDKMPGVYRHSGVPYKIAEHWSKSVKETPMIFFDAATVEEKDWSNIFIKVDNNDLDSYRQFWKWTGPNPYQVRIWVAEVVRKFFNAIMAEHSKLLEEQRNPEGHGQEVIPEEGEDVEPPSEEASPEEAKSWKETEELEKRLLHREKKQWEEKS
ncbi:MAG: hypothetical protein Q8P59_13130 [Dehalococcoidia bacterium]|nr:hypothetical protein [Dehalococcoidia bacterium]